MLERIQGKHTNTTTAQNNDIMPTKNTSRDAKMDNQILKNRLDEAKIQNEIMNLPLQKFKNPREFTKLFDSTNGAMGIIKTPYKDISVRIPYAYRHFYDNTTNKNRDGIKSAFFETFRDPLFITKEQRGNKDSVYFYKPFFDKDKNIINLFGIGVDSQNRVDFKTFYLDELGTRIKQVLKVKNENILYLKK